MSIAPFYNRLDVPENLIISYHPNGSTHYDDHIHEEGNIELNMKVHQRLIWISWCRDMKLEKVPTLHSGANIAVQMDIAEKGVPSSPP
jgi:deoxycytidylate deaminase